MVKLLFKCRSFQRILWNGSNKGSFYAPQAGDSGGFPQCAGCEVTYIDSNGTSHITYQNNANWNAGYTIDGSNIHLRYENEKWFGYTPDGTIMEFGYRLNTPEGSYCGTCIGPGKDSWYLLTKVSDRFGNSYELTYEPETTKVTSIYDSKASSREILFFYEEVVDYLPKQLSKISVPTPNGFVDYTFDYSTQQGPSGETSILLSRINFPKAKSSDSNNLSISFSYYERSNSSGYEEKACALKRITYSTGGYTEYDYGNYTYYWNSQPNPKADPRTSVHSDAVMGFGVTKITKFDGTNFTERKFERVERIQQCAPFASVKETLPDGQKSLTSFQDEGRF